MFSALARGPRPLPPARAEIDVKCNRCGEMVCSQRRAVALGWWFGAFVVAGVVGTAGVLALRPRGAASAAPQLAIAAEDLPGQPSAPALALLKAFDRDGAGVGATVGSGKTTPAPTLKLELDDVELSFVLSSAK